MNEATATITPAPQEIKLTPAQEARFWAKVNKAGPTMPGMDTPCWVWTGCTNQKNYGQIRVKGTAYLSHRFAWMLNIGPIPHDGSHHGICVCHRCDNPACVNTEHLFLGTQGDNLFDMNSKGRNGSLTKPERLARGERHGTRTKPEKISRGDNHYARLHPERLARGDKHGSRTKPERLPHGVHHALAKLTDDIVIRIHSIYAAGRTSQRRLAAQFGVSQGTIGCVLRGKIWKHVPAITTVPQSDT